MKITKLTEQIRNKSKINVFIDEDYAFSTTIDIVLQKNLFVGKDLNLDDIEGLKRFSLTEKCYSKALDYLSRRQHSEAELKQKLAKKAFSEEDILNAFGKLRQYGYLDDLKYAESYLLDKKEINLKSKKQINFELRRKGITKEVIEKVEKDYPEAEEIENIKKLLEKKYNHHFEKEKALRFLAGRGFSYSLIKEALEDFTKKAKSSS